MAAGDLDPPNQVRLDGNLFSQTNTLLKGKLDYSLYCGFLAVQFQPCLLFTFGYVESGAGGLKPCGKERQ